MPTLIGQLPESGSFVGSPFCSTSLHHTSNASSIFVAQVGRKETHKYRASIQARLCVGDTCQLSHSVFNKAQPAGVVGGHCSSCLEDEIQGGGAQSAHSTPASFSREPAASPEDSRYMFHDSSSASPTSIQAAPLCRVMTAKRERTWWI